MPVYEYGCTACGSKTEVIQRFSDPPLEICEKCGAPVKKLISNTSFVLKGSGWYVTDYGKSGTPPASKEEGKEGKETKGEAKGETKSETKSEAKTEAASSSTVAPSGSGTSA